MGVAFEAGAWLYRSTNPYAVGTGDVSVVDGTTRLQLGASHGQHYSDAQLDDYHQDGVLRWRPPVQMTLRARFSDGQAMLKGTAGFGFWNDPFEMTRLGQKARAFPRFRFPQALWFFFASPPSDMPLAKGVPGMGWKAATIDASRLVAKALLPLAPLGMIACRWNRCYQRLWPIAQRVLKIDEMILPTNMEEMHEYRLEWENQRVSFYIDGVELFHSKYAPQGPLGFVAWIDNQFMVATPRGQIQNGIMATDDQWLEIASLDIRAD